jgi:mono/diheme cytochrome c family protein
MTGPPFLSDQEVALFGQWIAGGLQPGKAAVPQAAPAKPVAPLPRPGEPVTYAHVAPVFATRCAKCHTDNGLMGPAPEGYRLTSYESTLSTADRVRVVPGNPAASELLRRIKGQAEPRMPFDGPPFLDAGEIRLIESWIAGGARSASGQAAPVPIGARVRLHGILGSDRQLDGLPLVMDSGTRIDKRPQPGDYVQVRGSLGPNGEILVERMRRR